jgi:hypothetical protein
MNIAALATLLACGLVGTSIGVLLFSKKSFARRASRRLSHAITNCQRIFRALGDIPDTLISRDLRIALVLLLKHHIETLSELQPRHPFIIDCQNRLERLNQIPSAFARSNLRTKNERATAAKALESLTRLLQDARAKRLIPVKRSDLAAAAARLAVLQLAVESARQDAKDAEHVRAYRQAMQFSQQALALAKSLPPMMSGALSETLQGDLERLEHYVSRAA